MAGVRKKRCGGKAARHNLRHTGGAKVRIRHPPPRPFRRRMPRDAAKGGQKRCRAGRAGYNRAACYGNVLCGPDKSFAVRGGITAFLQKGLAKTLHKPRGGWAGKCHSAPRAIKNPTGEPEKRETYKEYPAQNTHSGQAGKLRVRHGAPRKIHRSTDGTARILFFSRLFP